jgi:hypothetical protein
MLLSSSVADPHPGPDPWYDFGPPGSKSGSVATSADPSIIKQNY